MTIIDFHNHYYPPQFVEEIGRGPSAFRVTHDQSNNPVLHSPGDYNVLVPGHRDIAFRQQVLDDAGIDMQVLSFTAPGTSIETPKRAEMLATLVNDSFADIVQSLPQRFQALAHLPMTVPKAATSEVQRVLEELNFPGVMLFSNAGGIPIADERFWPVYEILNEHEAVAYIHPTYPLGVEAMEDYMLMPLVGFLFDTTLAAAHLVYAGVPERFPNIRWALCHLGGAIPYLAERLDRGFEAFEDCRKNLKKLPSDYLREFYYDTVNFDTNSLRLAIDFAGTERIIAGSDYPHMIGSIDKMLSSIRALELGEEVENAVLGGNAMKLLGL